MSVGSADAAVDRVILIAREKRERVGASRDGRIVIPSLTPEEALALDGLLSRSRRKPVLPGATLRVALSQLEAALLSCGINPRREYERVGGGPLRDLPADRAAQRERRSEFRSWVMSHPTVLSRPPVAEWFEQASRQGRVHEGMRSLARSSPL